MSHAEDLHVAERLVTAPRAGVFHPAGWDLTGPEMVAVDDEIGVVVQSGEKHAVTSRFTGLLMGLLVLPGERVRAHQPVAWLTLDEGRGAPLDNSARMGGSTTRRQR
jgi:biotin carboxyl carrier protein